MSEFLKKFSKDEYPKEKKQESDKIVVEKMNSKKKEKENNIFQTSNTKEEVYVQDKDKVKKRRNKLIASIVIIALLFGIGFFIYHQINMVHVPNFALEKNLNDVEVWAAKNSINISYTEEYSLLADEGIVIEQSKGSDSIIAKGSSFKVKLSKGADPNEYLDLPDFSGMTLVEIEEYKNKNKASNIIITKVFDDEIKSGMYISMKFKTDGINKENYRRKDKLEIVISKGSEVFEKDISVPNWYNKPKYEVEEWAKEKGVDVEFVEEPSDTVEQGNVISQSISAKEKIAKNESVKVVVSRGNVLYVPNFSGLNETQAQIEATKSGINTQVFKYYNNKYVNGDLISQSIEAGSETNNQTSVALVYSLGKPYISNYDGQDVYMMVDFINTMNASGANITYEIEEISSDQVKGIVVTSSVKAAFVNTGSKIVIYVSNGVK